MTGRALSPAHGVPCEPGGHVRDLPPGERQVARRDRHHHRAPDQLLDDLEPDADLEDGGDTEPSLGGWIDGRLVTDSGKVEYDLEADGADDEPYLGAFEHHPDPRIVNSTGSPERWASSVGDDREADAAENGIADGDGLIEQLTGCSFVPSGIAV